MRCFLKSKLNACQPLRPATTLSELGKNVLRVQSLFEPRQEQASRLGKTSSLYLIVQLEDLKTLTWRRQDQAPRKKCNTPCL